MADVFTHEQDGAVARLTIDRPPPVIRVVATPNPQLIEI